MVTRNRCICHQHGGQCEREAPRVERYCHDCAQHCDPAPPCTCQPLPQAGPLVDVAPVAVVAPEVADAFGLHGFPNVRITFNPSGAPREPEQFDLYRATQPDLFTEGGQP